MRRGNFHLKRIAETHGRGHPQNTPSRTIMRKAYEGTTTVVKDDNDAFLRRLTFLIEDMYAEALPAADECWACRKGLRNAFGKCRNPECGAA